jgi:hypothetical protein
MLLKKYGCSKLLYLRYEAQLDVLTAWMQPVAELFEGR